MNLRYLITANKLELFQPQFDSTIRIAAELLKRKIPCDYLDTDNLDLSKLNENFLKNLPVYEILSSDPTRVPFFETGPLEHKTISDYQVAVHRRDPPVDDVFVKISKCFSSAPKTLLQINDPYWASHLSEHELPMQFPEFATPTFRCGDFALFQQRVREIRPESVAKPLNQSSGIGIGFFSSETSEQALKEHWDKWGPLIVQPFIPDIQTKGDLRIAVINQKILGSVTRIPKKGSRLGNLHAGASASKLDPTPNQITASLAVAKELSKKGLHFLGLDFIGPYLNEINITSPSAIVQINEVNGKDHFPFLIDEFENLRKAHLR
jgi:glutathione synthase